MNFNKTIPIIIPSLEPDERLFPLLKGLKELHINNIIIVNDGSPGEYDHFFQKAKELYGCTVLKHYVNLGKGRALKDAFNYCLENFPNLLGCITADSDGQHKPEDIQKCIHALLKNENSLILGCRDFSANHVPFKSKFGNKLTRKICKWLCGVNVTDTQTGLRAIPKEFMVHLLNVPGERFEFETNMLLETATGKNKIDIKEITIQTVYDSKENHITHFDPIKDSIKIYKIFGRIFGKFIISSMSSCILDLLLFTFFCKLLGSFSRAIYAALATILARVISATYNYFINYKVVFKSGEGIQKTSLKYFCLAIIQMGSSAGLVAIGVLLFKESSELFVKVIVDTVLFLLSYWIQRTFIFN